MSPDNIALALALLLAVAIGASIYWRSRSVESLVMARLREPRRLAAAEAATAFVLPPDEWFDARCAALARDLKAETAFCTFVLADRQVFKGWVGFSAEEAQGAGGLDKSICKYVAALERPLLIRDVTTHPLMASCSPAGFVTSYGGHPVSYLDETIGAMAVTFDREHQWAEQELATLRRYAREVEVEITHRSTPSP